MDASSIIAQVSRDDELGAFNNEKGVYRRCTSRAWLPCRPVTFPARCLPGFRSPAPVTAPAPVFSLLSLPTLPTSLLVASSLPLSLCEQLLACLPATPHLRLLLVYIVILFCFPEQCVYIANSRIVLCDCLDSLGALWKASKGCMP